MQVKSFLGLTIFKYISELFIILVVGIYIAFIIIKNLVFKALLNMFLSILFTQILNDNNVFQYLIIKIYHNWKILLSEDICLTRNNIHFSFDLQISENSLIFLAIVAHFISENEQYNEYSLAFDTSLVCMQEKLLLSKVVVLSKSMSSENN